MAYVLADDLTSWIKRKNRAPIFTINGKNGVYFDAMVNWPMNWKGTRVLVTGAGALSAAI